MKELAAICVCAFWALAVLAGVFNAHSEADVRDACRGHRGVQQVEHPLFIVGGFDYAAVVVCRDGHVEGVQ